MRRLWRWQVVTAGLALVLLVAIGAGCERDEQAEMEPEPAPVEVPEAEVPDQTATEEPAGEQAQSLTDASGEIVMAGESEFDSQVLQSEIPVLVDFYADWCGPCRAMHPALEAVAEEYAGRVKVVQVNVDNNPNLAQQYNIRSIPALFVIKGGQAVDQVVGQQSESELQRLLNKHI